MKTNFENIGGSYSQQGDYLLPNLTLLDENQRQISVWAMRHRRYLKSSHRVLYYNLLTSGKPDDVDVQNGITVLPLKSLPLTKLFTGQAAMPHQIG